MLQRNEKLKMTNNLNVPKEKLNFERINEILEELKTILWYEPVIYGNRLESRGNTSPKENAFIVVREYKSNHRELIGSFYTHGSGFFLDTEEFTETVQIYKSTQDQDLYYTIVELIDKKNGNIYLKEEVLNKKELINFLNKYFDCIKSSYISV